MCRVIALYSSLFYSVSHCTFVGPIQLNMKSSCCTNLHLFFAFYLKHLNKLLNVNKKILITISLLRDCEFNQIDNIQILQSNVSKPMDNVNRKRAKNMSGLIVLVSPNIFFVQTD
ncbi:hypothetical protein BpHYR1_049365 [Brachionus plicatilis]|uniref:Uncharacterized protein n=1 Tax=Brachionus plicatilis TaxID=10195 RepID=A0A3M7SRD9_BRAPC|nr:hypothetical protein BpHYR1_049365 [Brachionus plicatilis]